MFLGCTSLTTAPELPATTMAEDCYAYMFSGCSTLITVPSSLPAATLAEGCYYAMFDGCSALTTAPALPATTLAEDCYAYMFYGCSSLSSITVHFATWSDIYTDHWVEGVGNTGIRQFHCRAVLDTDTSSIDRVPVGWTVIKDVPEPAP